MSHWQTGKIELKCSIDVLRKALINIMPQWEDKISTSETPSLTATFRNQPRSEKYNLVVSNINYYGDLGFKKNEDGSWEIGGDHYMKPLENQLTGEVARMKAIAIAKMRGYEIIKNEEDDNIIVTEIQVDSEKAKELLA